MVLEMIKNSRMTGKNLAIRKQVGAQVEAWVAEAMHGSKEMKTMLIYRPDSVIRVTVETVEKKPLGIKSLPLPTKEGEVTIEKPERVL